MAENVVSRKEALDLTLADFHAKLQTLTGDDNLCVLVLVSDKTGMSFMGNVTPPDMAAMLTEALVSVVNDKPNEVKELRRSS